MPNSLSMYGFVWGMLKDFSDLGWTKNKNWKDEWYEPCGSKENVVTEEATSFATIFIFFVCVCTCTNVICHHWKDFKSLSVFLNIIHTNWKLKKTFFPLRTLNLSTRDSKVANYQRMSAFLRHILETIAFKKKLFI